MNVGSSFVEQHYEQVEEEEEHQVQEQEYQVDEHGEGLIDAPKGRSANYTVDEDKLLCKTWLKIGMDPAVGTDQTKDTYWARMKEYFDANNTSGNERSNRSLRSRWSLINQDCQKWGSVQDTIDVINPSGTNDVDRVSLCCEACVIVICIYLLSWHTNLFSFVDDHGSKLVHGKGQDE